ILEVMTAENFYRIFFLVEYQRKTAGSIRGMGMALIGDRLHIRSVFLADHERHGILLAVNERSALRCLVGKDIELLNIFFLSVKHIGVVPGNSADQSDVVVIAEEFWCWIQRRGE